MSSCGSGLGAFFAPTRNAIMVPPPRPRGRPPSGCQWANGGYVSTATDESHCPARSREDYLQRRRLYDKARYWNPAKNVRKQRLQRSARKSVRPPSSSR